jgi:hypothetical protein
MNCQDMNSLRTGDFINYSIIAVDNFPNFILFSHFWNHTANFRIGLKNEVTFMSLSIVRDAYLIESREIYSATDFKSVRDL